MEFRAFYQRSQFQTSATGSAYLEVLSAERSTKISCTIHGPMQKQQDITQSLSSEQCTIKVNLEFADSLISDSLILAQNPDVEEQLHQQMTQMATKGAAESIKERRMKFIIGNLKLEMQKILTSCILLEKYPATTLVFNYDIVELDSDILQSMINCAAIALFNSEIECRCLPIGLCIMVSSGVQRKNKKEISQWLYIDPNNSLIQDQQQYSHKAIFVMNVNTNEFISTSLKGLVQMNKMMQAQASYIINELEKPQSKFEDDMLSNRRLFVMKSSLKRKINKYFDGSNKNEKRSKYVKYNPIPLVQSGNNSPSAGNNKTTMNTPTVVINAVPSRSVSYQLQEEKVKRIENQVKFQQDSSEDDEIIYNPKKMLDNPNERFYMSFNRNKRKNMTIQWNRLSDIICSKRCKEYNKFLNKIKFMQKVLTPKEIESRKKTL
ncbi:UNKNOWN [Stylonychia lemnae]|uniref:Exoribonuclease phosphorolytic domain-containing protein n=1 Tax=Stylonychia lemnae TaxID=5949 RepID=A0A078AX73_STYLE|nr:UNKNOWN [Stylonychia lemnae]|eukprot:CDW85852.1 UNKNOWN [Stylonychia lemnae]